MRVAFAIITILLFSSSLCEQLIPDITAVGSEPQSLPIKDKCTTEPLQLKYVVPSTTLSWTRTRVDTFSVCIDLNNGDKVVGLCDSKKNATVSTKVTFKSGTTEVPPTVAPLNIYQSMIDEGGHVTVCHRYSPCDVFGQLEGRGIDLAKTNLDITMDIANLYSSKSTGKASILLRSAGIDIATSAVPAEHNATMKFFGGFTIHYPSSFCDGKTSECNFGETAGLYSSTLLTASMRETDSVPSCTVQGLTKKIHMLDFIPSTTKKCSPTDEKCETTVTMSIKTPSTPNAGFAPFISSAVAFSALAALFV